MSTSCSDTPEVQVDSFNILEPQLREGFDL